MSYILIRLRGGISNKIRTLLGYLYISEKLNLKLYVNWYVDDSCENSFQEFFMLINDVIMINNSEYNSLKNGAAIHFDGEWFIINIMKKVTPNITREEAENELVRLYKKIVLKNNINDEIQELVKNHNIQNCIGIHIRRTDHSILWTHPIFKNKRIRGQTSNEEFFTFINSELLINPDIKIYMATDDYETQNIFLNKYKNNIIIYNKLSNNNDFRKTSIYGAIVDVYLLSHCNKIMGSYLSSFSVLAQRLKKIKTNDQSINMFPDDNNDDCFNQII
jgi:hypothetical protein